LVGFKAFDDGFGEDFRQRPGGIAPADSLPPTRPTPSFFGAALFDFLNDFEDGAQLGFDEGG
jgi:hypothetical protein